MAALIAQQAAAGHSMAWPNGAHAAIVLTYDDAVPSQLDNAIPALDSAGLKGTFFLSNVRQADVERWKAAAAAGHELANHTLNHPCLAGTFEMPARQQLEHYTPESVLQEVGQQNVLLTALDDRQKHGFAVPCGQTLAGGRDYLEPLRRSKLVTYSRSIDETDGDLQRDPSSFDPMRLPGRGFASPAGTAQLVEFAQKAAKGGGLAVYVFHGVGGDYLSVAAPDHSRFVEWLAAHRQTYWVATMRDVVEWIAKKSNVKALPRNKDADGDPIVTIESGKLKGASETGAAPIRIFRGIPFAAPPVADLRWREPQPVAPWFGIRRATEFGSRCMQQPIFSDMMFRSAAPSEDCLYLNVWTPAKLDGAPHRKLPVLVYVYGGGFMAGDSSEKRYDGAALARRGIVVVTMNYRLGVFGFFAHPELTAGSLHHASGNYGLLDQVAALAWVKRNIAAFGGNPSHITIGGESAGSISVSALMASPLTRGEISGAIGESGAMMQKLTPRPLGEAEAKGAAFAQGIGAPALAALRALPAETLLAAQGDAKDMPFDAVIDGYFLTEPPAVTFSSGKAAHVALLVGTNSQEAPGSAVFGDAAPTVTNYRAGVARVFGEKADAVFALYPARTDADVLPIATALASDDFLASSTWKWFELQRRTGAPTYYYYFTRVRPRFVADTSGKPLPWGAVHSAEIEYALGNLDTNPLYAWTDDDREVSATMSAYFANFIRTGNPSSGSLPAWPKASSDADKIRRQVIDVHSYSAAFPEQRRYLAAEPLLYMR
ncbi:MAG: carboxylesterase family protein [Sphingomicrobium sp.]